MSHTLNDRGLLAIGNPKGQHGRHRWRCTGVVGLLLLLTVSPDKHCDAETASTSQAEFGKWGVETRYISRSIAPGDDFYRYVNDGWLKSAKIPVGFPMDASFVELMLRTEKQVKSIVDDVRLHPSKPETPARQIADMYASYVDMKRRNTLGSSMLQPELTRILNVTDHRQIAQRMGAIGYTSLIGYSVDIDPGNPDRYILTFTQGGLGLPGRDYYLKKEQLYVGLRDAYAKYIEGVLTRGGVTGAKSNAADILAFETAIAARHWSPEQARDAVKNHHPMSVTELNQYAPGFDWSSFLTEAGYGDVKMAEANTDTAIKELAALFAATPVETLRAYMAFHYLDNHASLLSDEWVDANFDMYSRRLAGIKEQRPLDERAVQFLNSVTGDQLGKLYVERYFPPESKAEIDKLVKYLREAFRERLARVEWMDEATRTEAIKKLDAIRSKIGYPEKWHDYSSMQVSKDDLVGNMHRYLQWVRMDARAKLDEPVRRWEWEKNPQEVNAYFSATRAEIVFPAAILQPPFFDPKADPAVNFGAIGTVIGHELGHGFDDQGSRYDGTGALRNWWDETSRRNFEERTNRLVTQYSKYSPLPGLKMNGQLTLGENIGDLGGISMAWSGYQKFVATEYQGKPPVIDGFTGNQRFFLGYSQLWRSLWTDGFLRQTTLTDPHSPGEFRVNGVLPNFGPWYEVFSITAKNRLYRNPSERVSIW